MVEKNPSLVNEFAAPFSYVGLFLSGIFFLLISKDDFVRFHSRQSIVVFGVLIALQVVLGLIPVVARLVPLLTILTFVLWLILIYKAWMGERWEVPVLGKLASRFSAR